MKPKREAAPLPPETIPAPATYTGPETSDPQHPRRRLTRAEWERNVAWETVDGQFRNVETASPGSLHYALRTAARTIGGFMARLDIAGADATQNLIEAARKAGAKDEENAVKTIVSGLALGAEAPLSIGRSQ